METTPLELQPAANWYAAVYTSTMSGPHVMSLRTSPHPGDIGVDPRVHIRPVSVRIYATDPIPDPTTLPKFLDFPRVAWAVVDTAGAVRVIFPTQDRCAYYIGGDWAPYPVVVSIEPGHVENHKLLTYPIPEFVRNAQEVNDAS